MPELCRRPPVSRFGGVGDPASAMVSRFGGVGDPRRREGSETRSASGVPEGSGCGVRVRAYPRTVQETFGQPFRRGRRPRRAQTAPSAGGSQVPRRPDPRRGLPQGSGG